jgi:hypothetical protein
MLKVGTEWWEEHCQRNNEDIYRLFVTYCSILTDITIKELTVTILTDRNNHSVTIGSVEGIDSKNTHQ